MIVAMIGDGFISVRWQSVNFDVPVHHCRPHHTATPLASISDTGPPVPALLPPPGLEDATEAAAVADASMFVEDMHVFEQSYGIEACDANWNAVR